MRLRWPPSVIQVGLLIIAVGVGADTLVHATSLSVAGAGFSPPAHIAHFVVLVGMIVALLGVVVEGRRRGREGRHS